MAKESSTSWEAPKHPFRNILRFIAGDFVAKDHQFPRLRLFGTDARCRRVRDTRVRHFSLDILSQGV